MPFGSKVAVWEERIVAMFRKILSRTPNEAELARVKKFLSESSSPAGADPERRWVHLAHAFLASNEFTFLD